MPQQDSPLLSVIVRRFPPELEGDVDQLMRKMQQAAAGYPGFVGLKNSLSCEQDNYEVVTVFAFDSLQNLENWKRSSVRAGYVGELDKYSHSSTTQAEFGDLALLLHPSAQLRKIETVAILIFWILILGAALRYLASLFMPASVGPFWQNILLVPINVLLISYIFLPWSSMLVTRLKAIITGMWHE